MAGRGDCIDDILAAAAGRRTREEVQADLDGIDAAAQDYESQGSSKARAYQKATEDAMRDEAQRRALARKQERENAIKYIIEQNRVGVDLKNGVSPRNSLQAMTTGVNVPGYKSQNSMAALWNAIRDKWTGEGGVLGALQRKGLYKVYVAGGLKMDRDVAVELGELEKGDNGAPGVTKDAQALEIAKIYHAFDKQAIEEHNTQGGWIRQMQAHVIKLSHDPDAIRFAAAGGKKRPLISYDLNPFAPKGGLDADRAAWIADVKKYFDMKKTFGPMDPDDILPQMWAALANGDHFDYSSEPDSPIYANVAQKAAAHRELVPNNVDDLLAYNDKYGLHRTFREAKFAAYDTLARQTALISRLGTRPQENFDSLINYVKKQTANNPAQRDELANFEHRLRAEMAQLDGSANRPVNRLAQRIIRNAMVWERLSMLGRVALTHIEGLASKSSELRYWGVPLAEQYKSIARGFASGGAEGRELAELLWTDADAARSNLMAGVVDAVDGRPGMLAKAENLFFRMTGVVRLLDNQRHEAEQTMSRQLGMWRGKAWADVGEREQRIMRAFGIEEPEWTALNKVEWTKGRGVDGDAYYLTPADVMKMSDADVEQLLKDRPVYGQYTYEEPTGAPPQRVMRPDAIAKARNDLAMNLAMAYGERARYAMFMPSVKARAMVFGQMKPGSWQYEAWRLMMQFKMWPLEMFLRTWGREIYGGEKGLGRVSGILQFVVASTTLGVAGEMMRDLLKGENPVEMIETRPFAYLSRGFLRSGAGTMMGDYLLGAYSSHGQNALSSLAGPIIGQIPDLLDLLHGGGPGEKHPWRHRAVDALQLAKNNTPFVNLWFTDWAFQYLVLQRLQEMINPGYLARREQRLKQQEGIDFMLRPTAVQRQGLVPALAQAVGAR